MENTFYLCTCTGCGCVYLTKTGTIKYSFKEGIKPVSIDTLEKGQCPTCEPNTLVPNVSTIWLNELSKEFITDMIEAVEYINQSEWEGDIVDRVSILLECTYSDASAIVEAEPGIMANAWLANQGVEITAQQIVNVD
jgi:hypothetical protein